MALTWGEPLAIGVTPHYNSLTFKSVEALNARFERGGRILLAPIL